MPISQEDIICVLKEICQDKEIYVTTKGSIKGGLIAGGTTIIGGLLYGPPGLVIGGSIGGLLAYTISQQFKPVGEILLNLPQWQKELLHEKMSSIILHLDASDAVMLIAMIKADETLYGKVIDFFQNFITSDLNMNMKS